MHHPLPRCAVPCCATLRYAEQALALVLTVIVRATNLSAAHALEALEISSSD